MTGSSIALDSVVDYLNVALERRLARLEASCMEFLLENFDLVRVAAGQLLRVHPGLQRLQGLPITRARLSLKRTNTRDVRDNRWCASQVHLCVNGFQNCRCRA